VPLLHPWEGSGAAGASEFYAKEAVHSGDPVRRGARVQEAASIALHSEREEQLESERRPNGLEFTQMRPASSRLTSAAMFAPTRHLLPRPAFDVETEAPCGTSVAEAREALAFWRRRLKRLPWYRRAGRAEAREMVARWQRRMVQAELERWQLRGLARPLLALIDWWGPTRSIAARRVLRASPLARIVALATATVTVTAVAVLALVVIAISQLV
jgi:hypothetical protein